MKRLSWMGAVLLVVLAAFATTPVQAQFNELLVSSLNDITGDPFGCATTGTSTPCNIYLRLYADFEPAQINGPNAPIDGYPLFKSKAQRFLGDAQTINNYPGLNDPSNNACEAWYSIWTATTDPDTGTFISYYAAQSTIVNVSEQGDSRFRDCNNPSAPNQSQACFGAADSVSATSVSVDTPQGNIMPFGGLESVPIPAVQNVSGDPDSALLSWSAVNNVNTVNRPTTGQPPTPCPAGSTFDDLVDTDGPNPVYGVRLYVHAIADGGAFRSLVDLEGSSMSGSHLQALAHPGSQLACTGLSDCPGVHVLACNVTSGAACAPDGVTFLPSAQSFQVTSAAIDAALDVDGPLGSTKNAVFNTKVMFRGSVSGSSAAAGITSTNASVTSLFSGNSSRIAFGALVSRVGFDRAEQIGNQVHLEWSVVGTSFVEFRIERADDGVNFMPRGTVAADPGRSTYSFVDNVRIRGRRLRQNSRTLYRLLAVEPGVEHQAFTDVDSTNPRTDFTPRSQPRGR